VSAAIATLERTRRRINELIEQAAAEAQAERDQLERDAAQAVEQATTHSGNVNAAYLQGREDGITQAQLFNAAAIADERRAFLALIEEARGRCVSGGVVAMVLRQLGTAVALRG
jgi:hypothetical protein